MTIPEAKRITRMNEWKQLIHERQQSGQSVRIWCLQNGIRENSYYYWLRIIREEALCEAENRGGNRPLRKFCVSDFRQKQEYHM